MRWLLVLLAACDGSPGRMSTTGGTSGGTTAGTTGGTTGGGGDMSAVSDDGGGVADGGLPLPDLARNCAHPDLKVFNLDIHTVTVSGKLTVNHAAVVPGTAQGSVYLHNAAYDRVKLLDFKDGSYSQQVVPDTYDIYLEYLIRDLASNLPSNYQARIAGPVTISAAQTLDIDIPATTVSGTVKLNHVTPPASGSYGSLSLRDPNNSVNEARLGGTLSGTYSALVVPGTYDLYYSHENGSAVPANYTAKLQSGIVVGASPVTADVDIPSVAVNGKLTVNGLAPPVAPDSGRIYFRDSTNSYELQAAYTSDQTYAIQVVPATYDVYYQRDTFESSPSMLPRNFHIDLKKGVNMTSALTLDIDVPAATVSGALKLNGAAPPAQSGTMRLFGSGTNDDAYLGTMAAGSYSQVIAPGTYDVYYLGEYGGGTVADSLVRIQQGVVVHTGANTLDVNLITHLLSGSFTVNGQPPPAGVSAKISLRETKTVDTISLGDLVAGSYAVQVAGSGTFDLAYDWKSGAGIPVNTNATVTLGKTLSAPATFNIDIPSVAVSGQMTFNGAPVTVEDGTFSLGGAVLGDSNAVSYSVMVLPGIYDVIYQYKSGASVVPHDSYRNLFCAHVGN